MQARWQRRGSNTPQGGAAAMEHSYLGIGTAAERVAPGSLCVLRKALAKIDCDFHPTSARDLSTRLHKRGETLYSTWEHSGYEEVVGA